MWLVKLDENGNLEWEKTYGGSNADTGYHIIQTPDDGYLLLGVTKSTDGDISQNHGDWDIWLVKTDPSGIIEWKNLWR